MTGLEKMKLIRELLKKDTTFRAECKYTTETDGKLEHRAEYFYSLSAADVDRLKLYILISMLDCSLVVEKQSF